MKNIVYYNKIMLENNGELQEIPQYEIQQQKYLTTDDQVSYWLDIIQRSYGEFGEVTVEDILPPPLSLEDAKTAQLTVINTGFNSTLSSGFTAKTLVGKATSPHVYPSDATAQSNFIGLVAAFTINPNKVSVMIYTLDSGWVSHTKAEFFSVFSDGNTWKEAQYAQSATLEAKVQAVTSVTDVQNVNWTPVTY